MRGLISSWQMGQPEVEVHGFDDFDPACGERLLPPRLGIFPMSGAKAGWNELRRNIRSELSESMLKRFRGTVSMPFERGKSGVVQVTLTDDRGIESLHILETPT